MTASRHLWLVFVVALAVAASSFSLYFYLEEKSSGSPSYPKALPGGASPVSVLKGSRAVEETRGLHWSPGSIPVEDAVIVEYSDGTILWASRVRGDACSAVEEMARAITLHSAELPYTAPVQHTIDGVTVYLSMDKRSGGLHAFWCSNGLAIWVRLGSSGIRGLKAIIDYYKGG